MSDWLASYDAQCKAEGILEEQSESRSTDEKETQQETAGSTGMNVTDDKKDASKSTFGGSFGNSKSVGGGFGAPRQMMNPPPQTSFGATSTNRIGTGPVSPNAPITHDGRGPAIGSPDFENGGGNVISVGNHKPASACKTFSFASTNHARVTSTLKVSRFGDLAQSQQVNSDKDTKIGSRIPRVGGGYGTPESLVSRKVTNIAETQKTAGGGFGSKVGGGFGSRQIVMNQTEKREERKVEPEKIVSKPLEPIRSTSPQTCMKSSTESHVESHPKFATGGGFGVKRNSIIPTTQVRKPESLIVPPVEEKAVKIIPRVIGGGFGTKTNPPQVHSTGEGLDGKPKILNLAESNKVPEEHVPIANRVRPVGGGFGVRRNVTTTVQAPSPSLESTPEISPAPRRIVSETTTAQLFSFNAATTNSGENQRSTLEPRFSSTVPKELNNRQTPFSFTENRQFKIESGDSERCREKRKETVGVEENKKSATDFHQINRTFTKLSTTEPEKENRNRGSFVPVVQPTFQQFSGGRGRGGGPIDFTGQGQQQQNMNQTGRGQFVPRGPGQPFIQPPNRLPFSNNNGITNGQGVPRHEPTKFVPNPDEAHDKASAPAEIALINKYLHREVKMMKNANVDVQRSDPTSPLYSIGSFKQLRLKPEVLTALDCLGFDFPTRIQETALPLLLMEPPSNLIAQAQSGTGKTAAFVLTMLCRIDMDLKCPQCICIAPTLELAKQIGEVVTKMGQFVEGLDIHYAIKGANMAEMRNKTITSQIVIGTPATTRDYLIKYKCIDPSKIRCLVLDEADVMLYQQGFTDISTTIYNLIGEKSSNVQSMLFSATYDTPVLEFATKLVKNAIVVMLKKEEQALPNIKQFYVECASRFAKYEAIANLYSGLTVASSVIFCYTKSSVVWLCENMRSRGHQADCLHGDMTVVERADIITRFKRNEFRVLITTSVLSRGIDVPQVSVVINYDLPVKYDTNNQEVIINGQKQPDCETYLHRIGRTGRFGKMGIAINFVDDENTKNMIGLLENHFQMRIDKMDPSNLLELEEIEKSTYVH